MDSGVHVSRAAPSLELWRDFAHSSFISALENTGEFFTLAGLVASLLEGRDAKKLPAILIRELGADKSISNRFLRSSGIHDSRDGTPSPPEAMEA